MDSSGFDPETATTADLAKSIERVLVEEGPWEEVRAFQEKYGPWLKTPSPRFRDGEMTWTEAGEDDSAMTAELRAELPRLGLVEHGRAMVRWLRVEPTHRLADRADELPLRSHPWLNALERYHTAESTPIPSSKDDRTGSDAVRAERRRARKAMISVARREGFTWNAYKREFVPSWRWRLMSALVPVLVVGSVGGGAWATFAAVTASNGSERAGFLAVVAALVSVLVTILVGRR